MAVALVLLLAGGAYAGLRAWYGWGATEPESAMPAGVMAFARADLDPGYGQQLHLSSLLSKFPKPNSGEQKDGVEHRLLDTSSLGLDFATDVRPWFADRVGFAAWQDNRQQLVTLVALASKDDAKAARLLASAQQRRGAERLGFTVRGGYALLAITDHDSQGDAEAARTAATQHPLADSTRFTQGFAPLAGTHTALVYVDTAGAGRALHDLMAGRTAPDLSTFTGTFALSADAVDNGIEVRFAVTGLPPATTADPDSRATLDAMPATSVVAGAVPGLSPHGSVTDQLARLIEETLFLPDPESPSDINHGRNRLLTDGLVSFLSAKTISFAFTKIGPGQPEGMITATADGAAAADKVSAAVRELLGTSSDGSAPIKVDQEGSTVRVRFGNAGGGRLADNALYREAMAGGPSHAGSAFFLDVTLLIASTPSMSETSKRAWAPVKAVGLSVSRHGSTVEGLLRIVIR